MFFRFVVICDFICQEKCKRESSLHEVGSLSQEQIIKHCLLPEWQLWSLVLRETLCLRAKYRIFLHFNVFSEPLVIKSMQFFMSVAQLLSVISAAYQYGLILVLIIIYYTKWALLYEYLLKMYSFYFLIALNVLLFCNSGSLLPILSVTFHCTFFWNIYLPSRCERMSDCVEIVEGFLKGSYAICRLMLNQTVSIVQNVC